jgi:hypothetical protein
MTMTRGIPSVEARIGKEAFQYALGDVGMTMRIRVEREGEWMEPGARIRLFLPVRPPPMKVSDAVAVALLAVHHPVSIQVYGPDDKLLLSKNTSTKKKVCPKSPCNLCAWGGFSHRMMFK